MFAERDFYGEHVEFHIVFQPFDGISKLAERAFVLLRRGISHLRERACRSYVHTVVRSVHEHAIEIFHVPFGYDFQRAFGIFGNRKRLGDVVRRACGKISHVHAAVSDALQNTVKRPVAARKDDRVVFLRALPRFFRHILAALRRHGVHLIVFFTQRLADICELFFDRSRAAVRVI